MAWLVLGGDALSALGSGLTLPFLLVYLHTVRGIATGYAGLAVATLAAAGLVGNPLGGWLADRRTPRLTLILGLFTAAAGAVALANVHSLWQAFAATGLVGLGAAVIWPAQDALLATLTPLTHRSTVFAARHATMNIGLGAGAALAGGLAHLTSPSSFQLLYLLDAATFLAFIPVLLFTPALRRSASANRTPLQPPSGSTNGPEQKEGFRQVLADRPFRRLWLAMLLLVTAGAAQFQTAFPAYATDTGHLTAGGLATVYAVNSCTVVLMQLPVLRLMRGRRRTHGLALVGLCWATAWILALAGGQLSGGTARMALFATTMAIFAIGETFLSPTSAPLVNDLASDQLRGRYNGLYAVAWTSGTICGPALAGLLLAAHQAPALFTGCIILLLIAAGLARHLGHLVPPTVNRVPKHTTNLQKTFVL
ncbi:MFS transporter [Streptomyces caelestis]|uniref:MFS transporter n=1 Tax=Streptomyces caelestis TaxID=36816 RepID=UPI00365FC163